MPQALPDGFVYLEEFVPSIQTSVRYASEDNFLGRAVAGYNAYKLVISKALAECVKKAQEEFMANGLSLLVYDAYRPQQAVEDFYNWTQDVNDQKMKQWFYPDIPKEESFARGFIARRSMHTRGAAVDLTLIESNKKNIKPIYQNRSLPDGKIIPFIDDLSLDMGGSFDLFDAVSSTNYANISEDSKANRQLLYNVMTKLGLKNYEKEWWHFSLSNEPFPEQYFDFPVE